jgi:hypothetical protein
MSKTVKAVVVTVILLVMLCAIAFLCWYIYFNNVFGIKCSLGHHYSVTEPAVPATCLESGLTEGAHCAWCGEIITKTEVVPAKGHTSEIVEGYPASCTANGLTDEERCSVCQTVLTAATAINAKGHTFGEWVITKESTCIDRGTKQRKCSDCDVAESEDVLPNGHSLTTAITPADCTNAQINTTTCSKCNYRVTAMVNKPLGHKIDKYTYNNDATCTANGTETGECERCHVKITRAAYGTAGHKLVTIPAEPATCATDGWSEGSKCSVCGYVAIAQTRTEKATGHQWDYSISGNTATYTCRSCSVSKTEDIKPISAVIKQTGTSLVVSTSGASYGYEFTVESSGGVGKHTYTYQLLSNRNSTTPIVEVTNTTSAKFDFFVTGRLSTQSIKVTITDEVGITATFIYSVLYGTME